MEIHLALGLRLLLLEFDQNLHILGFLFLLVLLLEPQLTVHLLVHFGFEGVLLRAGVGHVLVLLHSVVAVLLRVEVLLGQLGLLLKLLTLALELLLSKLHVAATLAHDIRGALASLVNLLHSLHE